VIGATGVLGRHTVPRLIECGHRVNALVRSQEASQQLRDTGAATFFGDILEPATLPPILDKCDIVLHLATAVPRPGQPLEWSRNDRIRREGTSHLLQACKAVGVRRYLQQSIAMLQSLPADAWADESVEPYVTPITQSAWDMEESVRKSGLDWLILRGGLFYGPGTGRDAAWRSAAREGTLTVPEDGSAFLSLIHVSDMAEALVKALPGPSAATLAVVDDAPPRYSELFSHVAALEGAPPPKSGSKLILASFRVPNHAVKAALAWSPHYRSMFSGLASCEA
jgi:2-alkyl-3-oxoalkanoate reductase